MTAPDPPATSFGVEEADPSRYPPVTQGKSAYHEALAVRRYDLVHTREDLDLLDTKGGWLIPACTTLAGIAATSLVTALVEINSHPEGSYVLRFSLLLTAAVGLLGAVATFALDKFLAKKVGISLKVIKGRVDELISMFDQESSS